ncbi:MAG: hypothetical protein AABM40_03135 [Chloroflexota bacterium]
MVTAIEARGPRTAITFHEVFQHRADPNDDWPQRLRTLTDALDTQLRIESPAAAVIRALDWWPKRAEDVSRKRYGIDGVLLTTFRRRVPIVAAKSGQELAVDCGLKKKDELVQEARGFFSKEQLEAGCAVIGALVLAGEA